MEVFPNIGMSRPTTCQAWHRQFDICLRFDAFILDVRKQRAIPVEAFSGTQNYKVAVLKFTPGKDELQNLCFSYQLKFLSGLWQPNLGTSVNTHHDSKKPLSVREQHCTCLNNVLLEIVNQHFNILHVKGFTHFYRQKVLYNYVLSVSLYQNSGWLPWNFNARL